MATDNIYNTPEKLRTKTSGFIQHKLVEKPWGSEELLVYTDKYVFKALNINAGERLSLQYHKEKMETLHLVEGEGTVFIGKDKDSVKRLPFQAGSILHIMPGTVHTFEAKTNMRILEVSTPQIWDVVRIDDKYGRVTE